MTSKSSGFLIGFLLTFISVGTYFYVKYKPAKIRLSKLQLVDLNANSVDVKAFEGKPLIVNFWATWCGPCIAEMPDFQKIQSDFSEKVNVIYISEEEGPVIEEMIKKRNYTGNFYKSNTSFKTLGITSWPVTYFFDKNGNLEKTVLGSVSYEKLLEHLN
jgi:thiol-disulfide isomerase/thioredoxin